MMVEPSDHAANVQARNRRRKRAAWKSGLILTGLGSVVLGAGYLAGVNAPAVAQSSTPQAVARSAGAAAPAQENLSGQPARPRSETSERDSNERDELQAPQASDSSQPGLLVGYDENGNAVYLTNDGRLVIGGSASSGSSSQPSQQFGGRSSGRGLAQQPGFSRPLTRSRGS